MVVFSGTVQSDFLKFIPGKLDDQVKLIDFAAGDFESLRQNLIDYTKANFPLDYNNFESSDFGVLLIELMSAIGHIQSHKSDYLANENFIRTARERSSVKKLLELIGVRMKGPISSVANAELSFASTEVGTSSLTIAPSNRTVTVASPEDGGSLTYTLYKVNADGTVDLDQASNSIEWVFPPTTGTELVTVASAVLMEGSLVLESGVFQSAGPIKSISLTQAPYVEKSAQVFITGHPTTQGIYKEEQNVYFASGSSDKVFQVTTNDAFQASILFGDNTVGLSPAVGDTYTVAYRVGGGSRGNIANSYINTSIAGKTNKSIEAESVIISLQNNSMGTGGADAESVVKAKRYAPLTFRSQDRLVTLPDYKAFTNSFTSNYGSTGKATAIVRRAFSSANVIDIFVLEKASNTQLRKATPEYKRQLLEGIEVKKMMTDAPVIVDGLIRTLDLFITLTLDSNFKFIEPEIISSARDMVLSYFNVDSTDFGEPFVPQDLIRTILQEDTRIRFAEVDNVDSNITIGFNEIIQLNNFTVKVAYL